MYWKVSAFLKCVLTSTIDSAVVYFCNLCFFTFVALSLMGHRTMERSLSLLGKSLIINVPGFSKFTYLARVLPMPSWVLTSINALVWPFLCESRMETSQLMYCAGLAALY